MSIYKMVIQHVNGHFFGTPGTNFLIFINQEILRDCTKLTETLAKSSGSNKETKCKDNLLMSYESVPTWLDR